LLLHKRWVRPNYFGSPEKRVNSTYSINNGMVEGFVTKLKLIKRQMYGKAGFALLRKPRASGVVAKKSTCHADPLTPSQVLCKEQQ
jgi:hypothetical protein